MLKGIISVKQGEAFIVPRPQMKQQIDYLDSCEDLLRYGDRLLWLPLGNAKILEGEEYTGRPALIVGKGPSLDHLRKDMIPSDFVVFACNESIQKVLSLDLPNPIMYCQYDKTVKYMTEDVTKIIVSIECLSVYRYRENCFVLNHMKPAPVGKLASLAAQKLGIKDIVLVGFDGAFGGSCDYAETLSLKTGKNKERFKRQGEDIIKALGDTNYEHVTLSKGQSVTFSYNTRQSQDSPQEQYEDVDCLPEVDYKDTSDSASETVVSPTENMPDHLDN